MKILFQDKNIICAIKDPGVPSQPDPTGREDMTSLLRAACGGEVFVVHRLDTATGGVMVYAKNSRAAGQMTQALSEGRKEYLAWVHGEPGNGEMHDLLFHDKRINKSFTADKERKGVKDASLEYETVRTVNGLSLVRIVLLTGRTHQIRVQFSSRGFPLVGDGKYGAKDNEKLRLWCASLTFIHPFTGEELTFENVPDEFRIR